MNLKLSPVKGLHGSVKVPGDKSISHRALIFGAIAEGDTEVTGLLRGADVSSTQSCLEALGVRFTDNGKKVVVHGKGLYGLTTPRKILDCGNSGTTIRLLMGLLSGQAFSCEMTGDASLCKRPMKRVADPLMKMGAQFELAQGQFAPLKVKGGTLKGMRYELPVASAQVKSALLLAGLYAEGVTTLNGKTSSRDHTEKLLPYFGVPIEVTPQEVSIRSGGKLKATRLQVPGDPSSAAFWMAAAAIVPGASVTIENVLLNPTRTGFIEVLKRMGAQVTVRVITEKPEPMGQVQVSYAPLKGTEIQESEVPSLIDEIPVFAVVAAHAQGVSRVSGAEELRIKESDRIKAIAKNFRAMGGKIDTHSDGFTIQGPQRLKGARIETFDDHRIAMAFSIASLTAQGETEISESQCVGISYPDFYDSLKRLTHA